MNKTKYPEVKQNRRQSIKNLKPSKEKSNNIQIFKLPKYQQEFLNILERQKKENRQIEAVVYYPRLTNKTYWRIKGRIE